MLDGDSLQIGFVILWVENESMRGIMKLRERRESGELVLFRPRLDQIIDMRHALVKLGRETDWAFLERRFGAAYEAGPGPHPG